MVLNKMTQGRYIVIEGTDGSGKTTQAELLVAYLKQRGLDVLLLHEPGGTPIGEEIRTILKNGSLDRDALTNVLLFSASRAESWKTIIQPSLKKGIWIVSARDYTSTLAYQGYGEGIPIDLIEQITLLATDEKYISPDFRTILDIHDEQERTKRITSRGALIHPDTFESRPDDFQQRLMHGYRAIAQAKGISLIDAAQSVDMIQSLIQQQVKSLL